MRSDFEQLTKEKSELLLKCLVMEKDVGDIPVSNEEWADDYMHLGAKIIRKRIEVLGLPIKFTNLAYLATACFCRLPGESVVLLIDALNKFEGKTVNVSALVDLYPDGFYTYESFCHHVDQNIKTKKIKWSEIY